MNKLNICIDIDGTITSPYHFIPYLNEMYNKSISVEECSTHDWSSLYGVDTETMLRDFHGRYMHSYGEAEIVEYAKEIIEKLKNQHKLYFVTARSEILKDVTMAWLNDKGFSDIEIYLLGSDYKINKAKELECHIFIEDNPSNAVQLAEEGFKVILINNNYNKDVEHCNIIRVNNWKDVENIIEEHR